MKKAANFVGFQIGWWASVLAAAGDYSWLGPTVVLVLLVAHLRAVQDRLNEVRLILCVGILGVAIDSALHLWGVLMFHEGPGPSWLPPPWLIGVWLIFATTLRWSLSWLEAYPKLAALLGGIVGPFSYYGGARLGALWIGEPLFHSLLVLAVAWSLLMPVLFVCSRYISSHRSA